METEAIGVVAVRSTRSWRLLRWAKEALLYVIGVEDVDILRGDAPPQMEREIRVKGKVRPNVEKAISGKEENQMALEREVENEAREREKREKVIKENVGTVDR